MSTGLYARLSEFAPPGSAHTDPVEGQGDSQYAQSHFHEHVSAELGKQRSATADKVDVREDLTSSMANLHLSADSAARNFTDRYDLHSLMLYDSKPEESTQQTSKASDQIATAKLDAFPNIVFEDTSVVALATAPQRGAQESGGGKQATA